MCFIVKIIETKVKIKFFYCYTRNDKSTIFISIKFGNVKIESKPLNNRVVTKDE